ncbi:beta-N-acetylhexosaminidase [Shinella sp. HZN7]|jgi:hexosaminidase|uniref:beta-N-acetylhexosaminidase n=1 Tax=Shinella sp. (strain HZN7) TaxID=879274 RepID=UPI0007DA6A07|nr:beta-N-acetylhexosaminidase [Shinella sp. HZN7]ANH05527.1 beta-N-acetylhexosaminidase [Shinella sp. HZN7]
MTASVDPNHSLLFETLWTPPAGEEAPVYTIRLTNLGATPLAGFVLCFSGPARLQAGAAIENGRLVRRFSNHSTIAPPDGFVLAPGAVWEASSRQLSYPLRHWSDGARNAYVVTAEGTILPARVLPTVSTVAENAPRRGTARAPVPLNAPQPLSIVPWPKEVAGIAGGQVPHGLALADGPAAAAEAADAFRDITTRLFQGEGLVRDIHQGGLPVRFAERAGEVEAYRLDFAADGVLVTASAPAGFLYGLITLGQIFRGARRHPATFLFPVAGSIEDAPRMGFRGCHLDVARQFYAGAEVKQFLAILAWNKLNRFHWHLTDDEAWRIEITAYPQLTEKAAWRGHDLPVPPLFGSGPFPTGGYYTQDEVREIVAHAGRYGIAVIPEIDVPGHSFALLQALPELRDPDETGEYASVQGMPNNCLNPAQPKAIAFMETVMQELAGLFPAGILHVGADEVPLGAWSGSPLALAMLADLAGADAAKAHARHNNVETNHDGADDIEGAPTAVLQAAFLRQVHASVKALGCVTGGWQEAAHGGVLDKASSYLIGWRDVPVSARLAQEGYDIVVAPGQAYYLDMGQSTDWNEPGAGWAGSPSPRDTYDFDPVEGWTGEQLAHFKGVQACIWNESMADRAIFDRLVFPRLSAIAETAWTPWEQKDWDRFIVNAALMPNLYGHWA